MIMLIMMLYNCHITGKYRGSSHRSIDINLKLNLKIPIVFQNLKNYDSQLIMQVLGKFNLKVNVISKWIRKISSLYSLVKNSGKYDFKYLSQ